jgi:ribosomal-protein-alanine N-acetyltransferase
VGTFKIVDARPLDIGSICAIQAECHLSAWTADGYESEMARPDSIVLAARSGSGETLGFIAGRVIPASHGIGSDAEIYNIGVRQALQKQGIGSMLLRRFIEISKRRGVERIWLDVRERNGGALDFYRNHGFLGTGRRKAFYTDPVEDAEIMCLRLRDADN